MTPLWVIDTNVLVSAALSPGGVCDGILQHAIGGTFRIAWDNTLLAEYRDVLMRPRFGFSPKTVRRLLSALPSSGYRRGVTVDLLLPDPDDLVVVMVALATRDKTIITGNPRHFPKAVLRKSGVTVLSPREALEKLDGLVG